MLIVVVIVPTLAAAAAVAGLRLCLTGGNAAEAEARELRRRVAALRERLGMRQRDGYVLRYACWNLLPFPGYCMLIDAEKVGFKISIRRRSYHPKRQCYPTIHSSIGCAMQCS